MFFLDMKNNEALSLSSHSLIDSIVPKGEPTVPIECKFSFDRL